MKCENSRNHRYIFYFLFAALMFFSQACVDKPDLSETEVEQKVFQLVNEYRIGMGLRQLSWEENIAEQCRIHSRNMANGLVAVGHDGFDGRVETLLKAIAFSVAGENVAFVSGYTNPAVLAVNEWLNTEEHRANIESDYSLTGVGVIRSQNGDYYITQIYVRGVASVAPAAKPMP